MANDAAARNAATKIANAVVELGLCTPRGGVLEYRMNKEKGNTFYRVGFSLPTALDGEINVYSPDWIRVWFALGRSGPLAGEQNFIFALKDKKRGSGADFTDRVIAFLRSAFVEQEQSKAMEYLP